MNLAILKKISKGGISLLFTIFYWNIYEWTYLYTEGTNRIYTLREGIEGFYNFKIY